MSRISASPLRFGLLRAQTPRLEEKLAKFHAVNPIDEAGLHLGDIIRQLDNVPTRQEILGNVIMAPTAWDIEVQRALAGTGNSHVQIELVNRANRHDTLELPRARPIPISQATGWTLARTLLARMRLALGMDEENLHPAVLALESIVKAPVPFLSRTPQEAAIPRFSQPEEAKSHKGKLIILH